MKYQRSLLLKSSFQAICVLALSTVFSVAHRASAQEVCALPAGETAPAAPRVTAQEVVDGSASVKDFALAVRDRYKTVAQEAKTVEMVAYHGCIVRQEGSPYRSGSTYVVLLTPDGRVFVHAKAMAFSGRQLNPLIYAQILAGLGISLADLAKLASPDPATVDQATAALLSTLSQEPEGAFDATAPIPGLGPAIPGASGHAAVYLSSNFQTPIVLLAGFDLNESHVTQEAVDFGDPVITAKEVVDRETLKTFVTEAGKFFLAYLQTGDFAAGSRARIALRDPNGPWRHGSVYLYVLDRTSNVIIFHGAFPDTYELKPLVPTVRDVVTGELVLPQVIAAATSSPEGGFIEYYFDDPSDDTDSANIPKVGYAREFTSSVQREDGVVVPVNMIVGSGFYRRATDGGVSGPGSGVVTTSRGCGSESIAASAVKTREDIEAFVECAEEYFYELGPDEARRAFNEDERWHHGSTYVFVDELSPSGATSTSYVYPPDPSREGTTWDGPLEGFGTDPFAETYRILNLLGSGWTYGNFEHPDTGAMRPKATYVVEVDWKGERAMLGAGIYESGLPSTCDSSSVNAAALETDPSPEALQAFVRCAGMLVESEGYFAKNALETDPQWAAGASYVFAMDMMGNQVITGNGVRVNGNAPHEWGGASTPTDQFGGRDIVGVGDTFGETFIYYRAFNPASGMVQPKVGMLKRVVSRGLPLLVGSGYYLSPDHMAEQTSCADHSVSAGAISNQGQIQAFVQCAVEYVQQYGPAEARRAFNEDERWKLGQIYVFADAIAQSGEDSLTYVFPPDPSREGSVWGTSVDSFGSDFYFEVHRLLSLVDSGWTYYAFTNPATSLVQPKISYVKEIDWGGTRAALGAGLYAPDLPGTCEAQAVNAAVLRENPDEEKLRQFVRCAAQTVEATGYFAGPVLASDPRWNHDSIGTVLIDATTGQVKFGGQDSGLSMGIPAAFGGQDIVAAAKSFGEIYAYSDSLNPVTGDVEPKIWFFKLVMTSQGPVLVASGIYPTSVVLLG